MNKKPISSLVSESHENLYNRRLKTHGTRFVELCGTCKVCIICKRGFNKKKGRILVESSMVMSLGLKGYNCS
jgi:hypothetical protein